MTGFPKQGRVRLDGPAYWRFKMQVHALDDWRCAVCRKITALTLHHLIKRSKLRLDTPDNCISLCVSCHDAVESGVITVEWADMAARRIAIQRRPD